MRRVKQSKSEWSQIKQPPKQKRWNARNAKAVWKYSRRVFSVSSVNGICHIALARSTSKRILWMVLFSIGLCGWFYQTTILLRYYYQYPAVVKTDVQKTIIVDFPAVTVCNINRVRKSQYCEAFPDICAANSTLQLSEGEIINISQKFMKRRKKKELGHQLLELIVKCEFTGNPRLHTDDCIKQFTPFYDPKLGNCYSLHSNGDPGKKLHVVEPDVWQDMKELILVLNAEHEEYIDHRDPPGLIVTMHPDMMYPDPFSDCVHVYADHSYNLGVQKVTVDLLPSPYSSNCTDFNKLPFHRIGNFDLTSRMCTVECVMHLQRTSCGHKYVTDDVAIFAQTLPYNPEDVTEGDMECAERVSLRSVDYCGTLCAVPCHDTLFTVNIDSSPTTRHMEVLTEDDLVAWRKRLAENKSSEYITEVHIHYKSMEHRIYRHVPEFNTEQLFSYLGGITGGWLGISLLEFCAFVEALFSILTFTFKRCRTKRNRRFRRQPVRIRPIYVQECRCHGNFNDPKHLRLPYVYY